MPKKKPASKQPSRPTPLASRLPRVTYPDYDAVFRPEDGIVRESPEVLQPSRLAYRDDARLLGVWVSFDQDEQKMEYMTVRKLDDATYVVAMDDDLYRAFHSDFAGTAFLSVQELNHDRLYLYLTATLSTDGNQLTLRTVSTKVVPEATKSRAALQKLIQANLANPALFGEPLVFTRKK